MGLYEEIQERLLSARDGELESLVLGWKGSAVVLKDGRWGIGAVPPGGGATLSPREDHTRRLLLSGAKDLAKLLVSPYPQEYAAASAAAAAIAPAPEEGLPLESLLPLPGGERVSLVTPDPWVTDFLRDWNWNISVFDDGRRGLNVFPEWTASQHLNSSGWVWLTAEVFRTRSFFSLLPFLSGKKVVLQGPGIPFLPDVYGQAGISFLVLPETSGTDGSAAMQYVASGGTPWTCPDLRWRVHPVSGQGRQG
ncbi:hypothetical protein C8D99_11826 [Aminivibrio pyruvatiphilus]|uniref:Putative heavy-metal chelation domain-containing protein n=2 Tax=Aminivibrio pyruvatiphilus TaxID=1005740 RepID=A0A4V3HFW6_9BACT|nr:hypothetical protein C8D99_11826 [Aminivibrio pyruvatiphilus]